MTPEETNNVMNLFADTLRELYAIAGLTIPAQPDPITEARQIANKIRRDTLLEVASVVGNIPTVYPLPLD